MNELLEFAHKFESGYSVVRRLATANGVLQSTHAHTHLEHCIEYFNAHTVKSHTYGKVTLYKFIGAYPNAPQERVPTELTGYIQVVKQCPDCARMLFHSHLYDVDWLEECPIHGTKLLHYCPDCYQTWSVNWTYDRLKLERRRRCPTCSLVDLPSQTTRRQAVADAMSNLLEPYQALVTDYYTRDRFRLKSKFLSASKEPQSYPRRSLGVEHKAVPALINALSAEGGNIALPEKLTDYPAYFRPTPIGRLTLIKDHSNTNIENPLPSHETHALALDALRIITSKIQSHTHPGHIIHIPISEASERGPCPYCLALRDWMERCLPVREDEVDHQTLSSTIPSYNFATDEISGYHYSLSKTLQRELYFIDLFYIYFELCKHYFKVQDPPLDITSDPYLHSRDRNMGSPKSFNSCLFLNFDISNSVASAWRVISPLEEWDYFEQLSKNKKTPCTPIGTQMNHMSQVVHNGVCLGIKVPYKHKEIVEISEFMPPNKSSRKYFPT